VLGAGVASRESSTPRFVGRRRELELLQRWLDEAVSGQPRVVLVSGDAGVGKSRLVQELQQWALAERGVEVCTGRCREQLGLPYLPFASSLLPRLEALTGTDPAQEPSASVISRLLGRAQTPDATARPPLADDPMPDQEKTWLFLAVTGATVALTRTRTLLLVLDDMHWMDRASLELFTYLVLGIADASVLEPVSFLIIATHRPDVEEPVAGELERVAREGLCRRLDLEGLDVEESAVLVDSLGLERSSRQLDQFLHEASSGNPLFLENLVRQIARGAEGTEELSTAAVADLDLSGPPELTNAIEARLDEVSEATRGVLTAAAFLGRSFSAAVLGEVTKQPQQELQAALEDAAAHGLIAGDGSRWWFEHPLYARVAYAAPGPARRRQLHLAIARALEESGDRPILEVALHLIEAGSAATPRERLEYTAAAGNRAWDMLAWADAARCYETAAAAAEELGEPDGLIADLHFRAGDSHYRNMDVRLGQRHIATAIDRYRAAGDVRRVAVALVEQAHARLHEARFGTAIDTSELDDTLEALHDTDPVLEARLLAQLGEVAWAQGNLDRGTELSTRGLEIGRQVDDHRACTRALNALGVIDWMRLDLPAAQQRFEDALNHAKAQDDPWLLGLPSPRLALTQLWLGDPDRAEKMAAEAREETEVTGDAAERSLALTALTAIALARGRFREAERYGEEAWNASRLSRYLWSCSFFLPAVASARTLRGAFGPSELALDKLCESQEDMVVEEETVWLARQVARAHAGKHDEVRAAVAAHPERVSGRWPPFIGATGWFAYLAELALLVDVDLPLDRIERGLARAAEHGMVITDGPVVLVPRARGALARRQGRLEEAAALLREAIEVARAGGLRPELGRSSLELAQLLAQEGDREHAGELAREARAVFDELDMPVFEQQAGALDDRLHGRERDGATGTPTRAGMDTRVILFTDIADSTTLTERLGDFAYRARADKLDTSVRSLVRECDGEVVEGITLGDGNLAVFPSARRAIDCARRAHDTARSVGFRLHVGIHAGDVIRSATNVYGGAVNIAARVCTQAAAGETLVSETVRSLARTSAGTDFADHGLHRLKGITDPHRLYAVVETSS
jgi:class 3 adenylate cyclase